MNRIGYPAIPLGNPGSTLLWLCGSVSHDIAKHWPEVDYPEPVAIGCPEPESLRDVDRAHELSRAIDADDRSRAVRVTQRNPHAVVATERHLADRGKDSWERPR